MFLLLYPAAGMSLYTPDIQTWRWGRNYGRLLAQGLSIKILSTSASRLAQKLHTTCWQYTSVSEVRFKQLNLDLSLTAQRITTSLNLPETEGRLLMFSHSGTTPKQCLEGNLMRRSLGCFSPHYSTAFQCSVICTVFSSILFFLYTEGIRNVNVRVQTFASGFVWAWFSAGLVTVIHAVLM